MRPSRTILLVAQDDELLSPLRFTLSNGKHNKNSGCYRVTTANSALDAISFMRDSTFDCLIIHGALECGWLIEIAKKINPYMASVYLFAKGDVVKDCYADAVLCQSPMFDVIERIAVLMARKRGPKRGSESAMRCAHNKKVVRETGEELKEEVE